MNVVKTYLRDLAKKSLREDGRKMEEYRDIKIDISPIPRANGSVRVKFGETEVLVGVKIDAGTPFPDTPNDGVLICNAELVPMASPDFEPGPPGETAVELARVVDRGLRESKTIDFEKLVITPGEKVWMIFLDIYPVNDAGNLLDASALGAIIALKNAVLPKYDDKEDKVLHKELTNKKLPIKEYPVLVTFGKIDGSIITDMTSREEKAADTRVSMSTLENGSLVAVQKGGKGKFTAEEIVNLAEKAGKIGKELRAKAK